MANMVPFVDPRLHYRRLKTEIDEAIISCLIQGDLVYCRQLKTFEQRLAGFVGVKYAGRLNSGFEEGVLRMA